jgi:hypothetical protein
MAHIPSNAKWYIAEIVLEITVDQDPRNVVHKNLMLIRADSPDEAYEKALQVGREEEYSDKNPAGKLVQVEFRGLSELIVVHGELEDGSELLFEEKVGVSKEEIDNWILCKDELTVFCPLASGDVPSRNVPDYSSGEIVDEIKDIIK